MKYIQKIYDILCISLVVVLAFSVMISVCLRYVFNITFAWAEEAITFIFIATTFFGVVIGTRENEHISINFINKKLNRKANEILRVFRDLLVIVLQVFIIIYSLNFIQVVGNVVAPSLRIPLKYFYYMMPLSSVLIIIVIIFKYIEDKMQKHKNVLNEGGN